MFVKVNRIDGFVNLNSALTLTGASLFATMVTSPLTLRTREEIVGKMKLFLIYTYLSAKWLYSIARRRGPSKMALLDRIAKWLRSIVKTN